MAKDEGKDPRDIRSIVGQHARQRPKQIAVVDERLSLTYEDLHATVGAYAERFRDVGIGPGDPVLVLLDVCVESVVTYWALLSIEAAIVVGDPTGTDANVDHCLGVSGAAHVLAGRLARKSISPNSTATWLVLTEEPDGTLARWTVLQGGKPGHRASGVPQHPEDWALVLFSSGTTSRPKAIVHSRESIRSLHEVLLKTWHLSPDDIALGALPFHAIYGLVFNAASVIYAGATLVLIERFRPQEALAAIERHRVTTAAFVPAMALMILNFKDNDRYDLSSLRVAYSASAPISHADLKRFAAFSGAPLITNYGMTEIPGAAVERADRPHVTGSAGKVSPGFEVCVRDSKGRPVPLGKTGEITMRGPTMMHGYLGDPALTAERVREGWIYSQDIGHMDRDGNIYLSGRNSEIIIRGGLNISPLEIENVLSTHDAVLDAAAIGTPDPVLGQKVSAYVVLRTTAEPDDIAGTLNEHCRADLPPAKVPAEYIVVDELPRNAGGKVLRKRLAERHAAVVVGRKK